MRPFVTHAWIRPARVLLPVLLAVALAAGASLGLGWSRAVTVSAESSPGAPAQEEARTILAGRHEARTQSWLQ